jgi:hypothetical protein
LAKSCCCIEVIITKLIAFPAFGFSEESLLQKPHQRRLIHSIRKGLEGAPNGGARFGVFTRWSHQVGLPRPMLLPIYIHAKVGIVDDTWCTVGSANLDGFSLDNFLLNPFFEQRAIELNAIMLNGVEGAPTSEAPDILRRKLWAEHLGYRDSSWY